MKKLILLLSIGLLIISCASEENETPKIETPLLVKIEQRQFQNGLLSEKIIFEYENQRPTIAYFYDKNNELTYTSKWNYLSNNYLSSTKGYLPNGTLNSETIITYDSSNRVIKTIRSENNNSYLTTTNYTYNNDNTITSNTNSNGNISSKIFEINNDGIINKEIVNGNVIVSIQYNNFRPITKTSYSTTYNYTYLENGSLPSSFSSIFGDDTKNVVLFQNSLNDSSDSFTSKLITKISSNNSVEEYTYTLNDDGFPLTKKGYYNGELDNEFEYFYK